MWAFMLLLSYSMNTNDMYNSLTRLKGKKSANYEYFEIYHIENPLHVVWKGNEGEGMNHDSSILS